MKTRGFLGNIQPGYIISGGEEFLEEDQFHEFFVQVVGPVRSFVDKDAVTFLVPCVDRNVMFGLDYLSARSNKRDLYFCKHGLIRSPCRFRVVPKADLKPEDFSFPDGLHRFGSFLFMVIAITQCCVITCRHQLPKSVAAAPRRNFNFKGLKPSRRRKLANCFCSNFLEPTIK